MPGSGYAIIEAVKGAQKSGFAAAGGSHNSKERARPYRQIKRMQGFGLAVGVGETEVYSLYFTF